MATITWTEEGPRVQTHTHTHTEQSWDLLGEETRGGREQRLNEYDIIEILQHAQHFKMFCKLSARCRH